MAGLLRCTRLEKENARVPSPLAQSMYLSNGRVVVPVFSSFTVWESEQNHDLRDRAIPFEQAGGGADMQRAGPMFRQSRSSNLAVAGHHVGVGNIQGDNGVGSQFVLLFW